MAELTLTQDTERAFISSNVDHRYGGDPDPKNNLGKAEKSKLFR